MNKIVKRSILFVLILFVVLFLSFKLSPYPSVWIIRYGFNKEANRVNKELANVITSPEYASITRINPGLNHGQLKGLILYCGIYEVHNLKTEGSFGSFLKTVMWSYFGVKDITNDQYAKTASITNHLTNSFPPSFISAGNQDPLLEQSKILSSKLIARDVYVDTFFFPGNYTPALEHEYQFTMDKSGKEALERSLIFLNKMKSSQ